MYSPLLKVTFISFLFYNCWLRSLISFVTFDVFLSALCWCLYRLLLDFIRTMT